jgi:endonuclease III
MATERKPAESFDIATVMAILEREMARYPTPLIDAMDEEQKTPYQILVATVLSQRTKDTLTAQVAPRLFATASTPQAMVQLTEEELAERIYPIGFYRTKARSILALSRELITQYASEVPDTLEALVALPGIGRKTANLILTNAYNKPGICVDTHVHRICNRWNYVQTQTPLQTEMALREQLPTRYWKPINRLLVTLGQHVCHPTSPRCSGCPIAPYCARHDVTRHR